LLMSSSLLIQILWRILTFLLVNGR
jgi:hypothetical protein